MACINGIEHLPQDTLREIMTRVAAQPGGAADIARAFSVCKSIQKFVEDIDVLKAVSFKDLLLSLPAQWGFFLDVDGLVARCSKAGNLEAKLILSKVALVSASLLHDAKTEVSHSDESLNKYHNLDKAARLLDHLSAENADHTDLLDLVRNLLSKAKDEELVEMQYHLKNFMDLYLIPEKKLQHHRFLIALENLCMSQSFSVQAASSDLLPFLIGKFNELCNAGDIMMKAIGTNEDLARPLKECLVQFNDDVGYQTLIERLNTIEPILRVGFVVASIQGIPDALVDEGGVLGIAAMLRGCVMLVIEHEISIKKARELLLESFSIMYEYDI